MRFQRYFASVNRASRIELKGVGESKKGANKWHPVGESNPRCVTENHES